MASLCWLLLGAGAFRSETGSLVLKESEVGRPLWPAPCSGTYRMYSFGGRGVVGYPAIWGITTIWNPSHSKTWNSQRRFSSFYLGLLVSVPSPGKDGCSIPIHSWESKGLPSWIMKPTSAAAKFSLGKRGGSIRRGPGVGSIRVSNHTSCWLDVPGS